MAHQGSHPGETGIQRRLRYHFFFHELNEKVHSHISPCKDGQIFTNKKTSEPIAAHAVPNKCWDKVSVDLFGPMPPKRHIVVVQDLVSRFHVVGKIISSTKASSVLPALADVYDNFGNPENQLSDNGPPFNSSAMQTFCKTRNIHMDKIPPLHPSANPVETFMKSIGKTMKIAHHNKIPEKRALNYRDTPHPPTGITPNDMLFRHPPQSVFPRKNITEHDVKNAQKRDELLKLEREERINHGKYRKESNFEIGDNVLIQNFARNSKFNPFFQCDPLQIIKVEDGGHRLTMKRISNGK